MKILTGKDIRQADISTVQNEPVSGIDLMERAAEAITEAILHSEEHSVQSARAPVAASDGDDYVIFAGKGNNGGDGLAVARLLYGHGHGALRVSVVVAGKTGDLSEECRINLGRLPSGIRIFSYSDCVLKPSGMQDQGNAACSKIFGRNTVIVDALLGTGVHGPVREPVKSAVRLINSLSDLCRKVVSIDMPSGLPTEPEYGLASDIVVSDETFTIEFPKLSLLLPETGRYAGRLRTVKIGLDRNFIRTVSSPYAAIDEEMAGALLKKRSEFDHKGTYGHTLIIAGATGMMGAAILCTGAALKSGCGLVSVHVPVQERHSIHISFPAAIVCPDMSGVFSSVPENILKYSSVAAGPGLGRKPETVVALSRLLDSVSGNCRQTFVRTGSFEPHLKTLVLDADALNIIASRPALLKKIPSGAVLTPHIGELSRLLDAALSSGFIDSAADCPDDGCRCSRTREPYPWKNDIQKLMLVKDLSRKLGSVTVVKGAHTMICSPDGRLFFNMSGNPGMAKGGSGDILTGLIAGLAARGYDSLSAAILGVWFHGKAGDMAASEKGMESMNASDILDSIRIM